jgi:hypothetical protein
MYTAIQNIEKGQNGPFQKIEAASHAASAIILSKQSFLPIVNCEL